MKKLLFVLIVILYFGFLVIDLCFPALWGFSSYVKFAAILLCFCLLLVPGEPAVGRRDRALVRGALCFTLLSDILLLFTDLYAPGMFIFCGAQLCYIARYRKKLLGASVILYGAVLLFAAGSRMLELNLPYELLAGGCYAVLILTAYGCSIASGLPARSKHLAVAGMTLFVLCDINVLLFNLLPISGHHRVFGLFMWFFYLPSQLCITLSAVSHKEKGLR